MTERTLRGAAAIVGVHDAASPTGVLEDRGRALEARMIKAALDDAGQPFAVDFVLGATMMLRADVVEQTAELEALTRNVQRTFSEIIEQIPYLPEELQMAVANVDDPSTLSYLIGGALRIETAEKQALLTLALRKGLQSNEMDRVLVFTRTKHGADRVVKKLAQSNIPANAIHGNKSQPQRERALEDFKAGRAKVLVATDIAARGIDVDGISHVINFDLPNEPESYVHRIGRTARAGRDGTAISLCDDSERQYLRDIEKLVGTPIAKLDTSNAPPVPERKPAPQSRPEPPSSASKAARDPSLTCMSSLRLAADCMAASRSLTVSEAARSIL